MKSTVVGFVGGMLLFAVLPVIATAHPGDTDEKGCHVCHTNCESWGYDEGEEHCDHGLSGGSGGSDAGSGVTGTGDGGAVGVVGFLAIVGLITYFVARRSNEKKALQRRKDEERQTKQSPTDSAGWTRVDGRQEQLKKIPRDALDRASDLRRKGADKFREYRRERKERR